MCILRFEVKQHVSALYGHHQVFSLKVTLYKLRCGDLPSDYSSSMPIYRRLLYYTDIYIQGVTGGTDQTSGVFLMLNYTDITQNTYIQS